MEITLNTPGALPAIGAIRARCRLPCASARALSLTPRTPRAAHEAGAEFIVTPTLQLETIAFCREHNLPIACGCLTPTEALAAHRAGADFIKLFPSDGLGPGYVRALLAPLPFLKIIPTGGVSLDNLAAFLQAGSVGSCLGRQSRQQSCPARPRLGRTGGHGASVCSGAGGGPRRLSKANNKMNDSLIRSLELFLVPPRWLFLKDHDRRWPGGVGGADCRGQSRDRSAAVEEMSDALIGRTPATSRTCGRRCIGAAFTGAARS